MSAMQRWLAGLSGRRVGTDAAGNIYFESSRTFLNYGRKRRWVVYAGVAEASVVPPEWHAWLHHTTDAPLDTSRLPAWVKPHRPNMTGTPQAYHPAGSDYAGGKRAPTAGDYEAWTPGS